LKKGTIPEIAAVMALCFGPLVALSLIAVFSRKTTTLTDGRLFGIVAYELAAMAAATAILRARGWTLRDLAPERPGPVDVAIGLGAALAAVAATIFLAMLARRATGAWHAGPELTVAKGSLHLAPILLASLVNPLFEEFLVCAFPIAAWRKGGGSGWAPIHISVAVRVAYHLYQGTSGVIGILPLGLAFALWYDRTRRVWPLAIAHCALDFFPLWLRTM